MLPVRWSGHVQLKGTLIQMISRFLRTVALKMFMVLHYLTALSDQMRYKYAVAINLFVDC